MYGIGFLVSGPLSASFLVVEDLTVNTTNMQSLKLILAAALIACLLPMPYGYYSLVRFVSMVVFAFLAHTYYEKKKMPLAFTFGALALLFQPFIKIALGRGLWNTVDVVVAIMLLVLYYEEKDGMSK